MSAGGREGIERIVLQYIKLKGKMKTAESETGGPQARMVLPVILKGVDRSPDVTPAPGAAGSRSRIQGCST